jgi:cell shape-determining protein MreD
MAHYPTHIDRQLWVGPGWEYFALNLQLLAGSSRLVNCVEWLAFIGCVIVTSQIAAQLGASRRGQWFAALFTATIPMAIAQASGSQVDLFAAFWDVCAVALMLRCIHQPQRVSARDALVLGACLGLAALSKGTAYLFLFPFLVWLAVTRIRRDRLRVPVPMTLAVAAALIMNAGIYSRNFSVYGTVLGRTSGPPLENAIITPASVASNAVRNLVIHGRSPLLRLNSAEERVVKKLHDALGIDVSDGRTSYYGTSFTMQKRPRSEGYVGNPAHLLVLATVLGLLLLRKRSERSLVRMPFHCLQHLCCSVLTSGGSHGIQGFTFRCLYSVPDLPQLFSRRAPGRERCISSQLFSSSPASLCCWPTQCDPSFHRCRSGRFRESSSTLSRCRGSSTPLT